MSNTETLEAAHKNAFTNFLSKNLEYTGQVEPPKDTDYNGIKYIREDVVAKREAALVKALEVMTEHYVQLAGCGDCGFWEPEEEDEVIEARKALDNNPTEVK